MSLLRKIFRNSAPQQKVILDRLRFKFGLLPKITNDLGTGKWLPAPYRAALVISADFELGWGYRFGRHTNDPRTRMHQKAEQTRRNFPRLLELFDFYETPITWATVGHLFLDNCQCEGGVAHGNLPRPNYFENEWWVYKNGDWYDADPCSSLAEAPDWYAPDLIRNILAAKVKHEIGCHTFSHIDCSVDVCSPTLLSEELATCQQLADGQGIKLKSFVFPGNNKGNLSTVKEYGFICYRLDRKIHIGNPFLDSFGLCAIPGGIFWEITPGWKVRDWTRIVEKCLDLALQKNMVLHLWFHPSCDEINIKQVFPEVMEYIKSRRNEIWVATMSDLAEYFLLEGK